MGTWNAYGNEYWPADYLIDAKGQVRYATFGEGDYDKTETAIRALLAEAGHNVAAEHSHPTDVVVPSQEATPETYLGTARGQGWVTGPVAGVHDYGAGPPRAAGSQRLRLLRHLEHRRPARHAPSRRRDRRAVRGQARLPRAQLDRERPPHCAGAARRPADLRRGRGPDVHNGLVTVKGERLYTLVSLPHDEQRRLSLRFAPGVTGYAFTFG